MFLNCPACLDQDGAVRCGLPAEIWGRLIMDSANGPPDIAMTRCPVGRSFGGPLEPVTRYTSDSPDLGATGTGARGGRDSLRRSQERRVGDRLPLREFPGAPRRTARRPNGAPAYYLGHYAHVWITVMRPHRRGR